MTARPNFFIVGAPKCGTTAWVEYLSTHPDIGFSRSKEPHFFNTDFPGFRWAHSEEEYLQQFEGSEGKKRIGEGSVIYLYSAEAAKNIAQFCPEARILIFLRDPESFLLSYHNQLLTNLDEDIADFRQAWALSGQRIEAGLPATCRDPKFLDYPAAASFGKQVSRYLCAFPPRQVMILGMEDWKDDPRQTYLRVLAFLGLADDGRSEFPRIHEAKHHASRGVAKLVQRPPKGLLRLSAILRRVLGLKRLGLARLLRKANETRGYAHTPTLSLDASTRESIRVTLAEDQALLQQRIEEHARAV